MQRASAAHGTDSNSDKYSAEAEVKDLCVSWLLVRVDVPDDVVGQAVNSVAGSLGHLGETFCLGLVLEGVAWEVDACAVR